MLVVKIPYGAGKQSSVVEGGEYEVKPSCMWFEVERFSRTTDTDCMKALIAFGIKNETCPVNASLVSFCFGKAILDCFGEGGDLELPDSVSGLSTRHNLEVEVWQRLHQASSIGPRVLKGDFVSFALRNFVPRLDGKISPKEGTSNFFREWQNGFYVDSRFPTGNLKPRVTKVGQECFTKLSIDLREGVEAVAKKLPKILSEVNIRAAQLRDTRN